jgi:poly-gamma-glutamate capsule biosynthesis protein CapA/YwtB (metallophosphatase superfamily)
MITVTIGADICPIGSNVPFFAGGNAAQLLHDLLGEIQNADLAIANLECPLVENASPIRKTGPTFAAPNVCINGIKAAGFHVLGLANNHIMDHGSAGLLNTLRVCADAGVATVGAGPTLADARRILVRSIGNLRIGILAVAEHEFSIARNGSPGANPLDLIDFVRNVSAHRSEFDYLIVLFHGSAEFHVPTPRIRETCRFMIEMGANAVIVQHPHCLGGFVNYRGGHIVYGQGALLMDEAIYRDRKSFHEGFLVKLLIAEDARSTMEIIPFVQSDPAPGARRMSAEREKEFRSELAEKSKAVTDDTWLEAEWLRFCDKHKHAYVSGLLGHNRILRKLNATGLMERFLYGRQALLGTRNIVCCETHREAIQTIFDRLR